MPESQVNPSVEQGPGEDPTSDEIARGLGSVWQRYSGRRPRSTQVSIERDKVRCVIEESPADAEVDEESGPGAGADPERSLDSRHRFDHNATAVITRATGRRVIAYIPKHKKDTLISTQTFILDRPRQRF
jgi:hypothetical protein